MNGLADINLNGEELTKEVKSGIEKSTSEGGFKYKKAPMEMFSKLDSLEDKAKKLMACCDSYSSLKNEVSKLKSYSRITSWTELLLAIPLAIKGINYSDPNSLASLAGWLSDYESVASEDGLRAAITDLEEIICSAAFNTHDMELITSKLNSLFQEFHDAGGEFFVIHNLGRAKDIPFSKEMNLPPALGSDEPKPEKTIAKNAYSRRPGTTTQPTNEISTESYGSFLKRMCSRK